MPSNILKDQPDLGTSDSRSLCIKDHNSAGEVLQLEIGPPSSRDRCLSPTVGGENVCQPTLDSDSTGSLRSESPTSHSNTGCTGVEVTGVVPGTTVPLNRPPSANTSTGNQHPPGPSSTSSHQGSGGSTGRMAHIRRSCQSSELSEEATKLLMASWRSKSQSPYNSLFLKWEHWFIARSRDPIHGPVGDIANFLGELFQEGYSYSSLNSYRSAISSVHTRIEGLPVGQHPVVRRILKGAYNIKIPKPRYKSTWRVSQVVTWLDSRQSKDLSLLELSVKAVTLCVLTRPCRSVELASMDCTSFRLTPEGAVLLPLTPPKQCRAGNPMKEYFFPMFKENTNICPASVLELYIQRTAQHRVEECKEFFITSEKPHRPATSATIARWIKTAHSSV